MSEITRVGVDLAKQVIQVHGVDAVAKPSFAARRSSAAVSSAQQGSPPHQVEVQRAVAPHSSGAISLNQWTRNPERPASPPSRMTEGSFVRAPCGLCRGRRYPARATCVAAAIPGLGTDARSALRLTRCACLNEAPWRVVSCTAPAPGQESQRSRSAAETATPGALAGYRLTRHVRRTACRRHARQRHANRWPRPTKRRLHRARRPPSATQVARDARARFHPRWPGPGRCLRPAFP